MSESVQLSTAQKRKYVKALGTNCPWCNSGDIVGESFDIEGGEVTQRITCSECDKVWTDIYALKSVEATT